MRVVVWVLWSIYAFFWIGGLVSGGVSKASPWAAPLFLVLAGTLALIENRNAWKALAISALLGFAFELIGVHTGYPFGRYRYTAVLSPAIAGVPVAIAFAWLVLIDFVRGVTKDVLWGALLMAAVDLVIDPLAAGPLHYWQWIDSGFYFGIPAINYVGWVLASILILSFVPKQPIRHAYVGWSVVAFFTVLSFEQGLYIPGLVGVALIISPLV